MNDADLTPLMRQYREIKRGYRDALLFFRVGDFYEMFYDDAIEASTLLSIALTSRDKNSADPVPLCGVPYHAAIPYIAKLLKAGRTVALCDQVEDPKLAKGLVRREVVRLYTPGTLVDPEFLPPTETNVLAAVAIASSATSQARRAPALGVATLEVSTGDYWVSEFHGEQAKESLLDELARVEPKEILAPEGLAEDVRAWFGQTRGARLSLHSPDWFDPEDARRLLLEQFRIASLDAFGCQGLTVGLGSAGAVLRYVRETQPTAGLEHIRRLGVRRPGGSMHLDGVTIQNLELLKPLATQQDAGPGTHRTLCGVLDRTITAMGGRLLREWLVRPLLIRKEIEARLDAVQSLTDRFEARVGLRSTLRSIQDISRLSSRVSLGIATPRDLLALKDSLATLPELRRQLAMLSGPLLTDLVACWDDARDVHSLIGDALSAEASVSWRQGGVIKDGYHAEVDQLRATSRDGKNWIAGMETKERERTGIESLKVRFNQVFGYYIEVTKANLPRVPADYVRKQTLVNAERFTTPELKELEECVSGADVKLHALEQELFEALRASVAKEQPRLQAIGRTVAMLDVLASLAEVAALHQYTRPQISDQGTIRILDGRHPVVEHLRGDRDFVPNDTLLDLDQNRLLIVTGPNMAGKSTYLRQVALITLMAQVGSFVPAKEASIGLVDRVFTRVGASDNLAGGQSTFMVEMTETAHILHCATRRSLILLDEIGRGTSTYDGLSIAWAVAEFIHDLHHLGARTLFATHYHEMTQLEVEHEGVKNYRVDVQERHGEVLFLRKIVRGAADRSYGIHVGRLAGLPSAVTDRAQQILLHLEQPTRNPSLGPDSSQQPLFDPSMPPPHPILDEVRQMDLFGMTPLDALNRLAELQRRLQEQ